MESYELSQRLTKVCMPTGRIGDWARLVAFAEDDLNQELLNALEGSNDFRKQVIATAACEGTGNGTIFGMGGYLNAEAVRYIRFVISFADTAISTKTIQYGGELRIKKIISALQKAYEWTSEGFTGTMSESQAYFAKASLVSLATTGNPFIESVRDEITYLAEHYDAVEPYLSYIIQTGDMSRSQLNMLLATKPVVPLTGGML
jgi:hypothetical protein